MLFLGLPCSLVPQECSMRHNMLPAVCALVSSPWLQQFPPSLKPPPVTWTAEKCCGEQRPDGSAGWLAPKLSSPSLPAAPAGMARAKRLQALAPPPSPGTSAYAETRWLVGKPEIRKVELQQEDGYGKDLSVLTGQVKWPFSSLTVQM